MMNQFTLRQSGNIGQEIISPRGSILAWTTDALFGELIVRILNTTILDDESLDAIFGDDDALAAAVKSANRN